MSVHIGTSGWNYPSGQGTWNGLFYPATRSKRAGTAGFDELRFYADRFDTGGSLLDVLAMVTQSDIDDRAGIYYMRLHGRNVAQWWHHDTSEDRYNYLYSAEELKEFAETAGAARTLVKKAYPRPALKASR